MATETQTFVGDSSQLQAEYDKLHAKMLKLEEQLAKTAAKGSEGNAKLSREMKELAKYAEQTTRAVQTPLEQYEAKVKRLDAALAKGAITQQTYARAVAMAKTEMAAAGEVQTNTLRDGLVGIGRMAAGWLSISSAIRLATAAYREQLDLEKEASRKHLSLADAQANVVENLGTGVSRGDIRKFSSDLEGVAARTGFGDQKAMYLAAGAGLSASAGDRDAVLNALEASAPLSRHSTENLETYVGGALDIRNATGNRDAQQNLSFLLSVGGDARVKQLSKLAKNVAPTVGALVSTVPKQDPRQAAIETGAMFSAFSRVAVDEEGDKTRTALSAFGVKLRDFYEKGYDQGTGKHKKRIMPNDPGTLSGRIGALRADPVLRAKFLEEAKFESNAQIPIEQLISGGRAAQFFDESRGKINFDAKNYVEMAANLKDSTVPLALNSAAGAGKAAIEQAELGNTLAARKQNVRDIVYGGVRQAAPGMFNAPTRWAIEYGGLENRFNTRNDDPEVVGTDVLKGFRKSLLRRELEGGFVAGIGRERDVGELNADEKRRLNALDRLIAALEEQNKSAVGNAKAGHAAAIGEMGRHLEK